MKLQNKQTGQVENFCIDKEQICSCDRAFVYDSLTQLQEAGWEDYKEDKYYWYIDDMGVPSICSKHHDKTAKRKAFGNYFETKEEAEKAVEKLKAWKRLKDRGFRFGDYTMFKRCAIDDYEYSPNIDFSIPELDKDEPCGYPCDVIKDLTLLFGGEE